MNAGVSAIHMKILLAFILPLIAFSADKPVNLLRTWQGIPGIERTPKGRLFVSWFSGGTKEPAPENTVYLTSVSYTHLTLPTIYSV